MYRGEMHNYLIVKATRVFCLHWVMLYLDYY